MATFSQMFSQPADSQAQASSGEAGGEYEPLGGEPSEPDGRDGPPPEVASEYEPLGGEPTDPGDPAA